ncbi:MAG: hypothetical protein H7A24_18185, partial [Leptospiraceae bacterium]|nr:hypothetical protein [Leptospiraceae bacterium]
MNSGKLLTNIFRYIKPLFTQKKFIFLWILVFSYKFVFNSFSADRILKKGFSMVSNGSLDVNVKKFSLLYGFLIEDILISNGENFQNSPVFRAKRVSVQYNLPALFTGSLRLTDISLSSPEIYLHKKGGVWNFDALFEPGEKKEKEKKKETPEEPSEPKSELNLYVPVSALLNFYIHDLKLDLKIEDSESPLEVKITDFNFDFAFQTYRFSKIPLSPKAVNIIE